MANTYTLISSVTVGASSVADINFTSIPATFTDLKVVYSLRTNLTGGPYHFDDLAVRLNGDTGSNYSRETFRVRQGTIGSFKTVPTTFMDIYSPNAADSTSNSFGNGEFYISNYTGSNYKSLICDGVTDNNATANETLLGFAIGLWSSASAVTSIKIYSQNATNFVQYSTAYLYGIKTT